MALVSLPTPRRILTLKFWQVIHYSTWVILVCFCHILKMVDTICNQTNTSLISCICLCFTMEGNRNRMLLPLLVFVHDFFYQYNLLFSQKKYCGHVHMSEWRYMCNNNNEKRTLIKLNGAKQNSFVLSWNYVILYWLDRNKQLTIDKKKKIQLTIQKIAGDFHDKSFLFSNETARKEFLCVDFITRELRNDCMSRFFVV